jgi:hypothetical protein
MTTVVERFFLISFYSSSNVETYTTFLRNTTETLKMPKFRLEENHFKYQYKLPERYGHHYPIGFPTGVTSVTSGLLTDINFLC